MYGGTARGIGTYLERFWVKIPDYFCLSTYSPSYPVGFSLGLEGNYVPFEANLTNDLMRLHERFCNLLKMNRFHGCLCGEPHESSLNSYNGKIRRLPCCVVAAIGTRVSFNNWTGCSSMHSTGCCGL